MVFTTLITALLFSVSALASPASPPAHRHDPRFISFTFDKAGGCSNEQWKKIQAVTQEAQELARAWWQPDYKGAAFLEFFGSGANIGDVIHSIAYDSYTVHAHCPGTPDKEMESLCNDPANFGDVAGIKEAKPNIKIMFCESWFKLQSLGERIKFVTNELEWHEHTNLDHYFRNNAISVLHELMHLVFEKTETRNVWMKVKADGKDTFLGAYGPLAAKLLARTNSGDTKWSSLNANNYAMYLLAKKVEKAVGSYPFAPLVDREPPTRPGISKISSVAKVNGENWSLNRKAFEASTFQQRYISDSAPDTNGGTKRGKVVDLTNSKWIAKIDSAVRDASIKKYIDGLSAHNIKDHADTWPTQPDCGTDAKPDGDDKKKIEEAIKEVCSPKNMLKDDKELLVPSIFLGHKIGDKHPTFNNDYSKTTYRIWGSELSDQRQLYLGLKIADQCSAQIMVKDAFKGKDENERSKDCIDKYKSIFTGCNGKGGRKTTNCLVYSLHFPKKDEEVKLTGHRGTIQGTDDAWEFISPGAPNWDKTCNFYYKGMPEVKGVFCRGKDGCVVGHDDQKLYMPQFDALEMQRNGKYC